MNLIVVKLLLLWTVCEIIDLTGSIPLETSVNPNNRTKRSPANKFSFFGISPFSVPNPVPSASKSVSNFVNNIFTLSPSGNKRIDRNHQSSINMQYTNYRPINAGTPLDYTYRNGEPNFATQHATLEKVDKYIVRQGDKNKINESENNHLLQGSNTKLEAPEQNSGVRRQNNETRQDLENKIDKNILDYIFQTTPDYHIDDTTVDSASDFTTQTGDYETTSDELLRIPAPVVASLLG